MNTRTALITGGTSGVGLSIAKACAKLGYVLFIIGRNKEKGLHAENELKKLGATEVRFISLDLSNLQEVSLFAKSFKENNNQLNLLANVAGCILPKREETAEGLERTFASGYLSAFLLIQQLLPLLLKSDYPRIVNVSASPASVLKTKLNFDDLNAEIKYNGFQASLAAVHAKTVLTSLLAVKLNHRNLTVNSFDPGMVRSSLTRHLPLALRWISKMISPFMSRDSETGIYVCTSDEIAKSSGMLFSGKKRFPLLFDTAYMQQVWKSTEDLVKSRCLL